MTFWVEPKVKNAAKFVCDLCDFKCSKPSNYNSHLATLKHLTNDGQILPSAHPLEKPHKCLCGKAYVHRQGLYSHKKKCNFTLEVEESDDAAPTDMVTMLSHLMQQNNELQKQLMEMCKINNTVINNTSHTNSHNKTFNLQVFLNEDCKDAINLTEFVDSFQLQLSDLESVGELGYVAGMSQIIMRKLNELDVYRRPIHCSDTKRETLHIKDNDKWECDTHDKSKFKRAIKRISKKNSDLLLDWKDAHPDAQNPTNRYNDQYLHLIINSMGGSADIDESENKIIRNIAKHVTITKW